MAGNFRPGEHSEIKAITNNEGERKENYSSGIPCDLAAI